jgi:hypothetical protein
MTNAAPHCRFWNWARRLKSLGTWQSALGVPLPNYQSEQCWEELLLRGDLDRYSRASTPDRLPNSHLGGSSPGIGSMMRPVKMPFLGVGLKDDGVGDLNAKTVP